MPEQFKGNVPPKPANKPAPPSGVRPSFPPPSSLPPRTPSGAPYPPQTKAPTMPPKINSAHTPPTSSRPVGGYPSAAQVNKAPYSPPNKQLPNFQKPLTLNEVRPSWNRSTEDVVKKSQIAVLSLFSALIVLVAAFFGVLYMVISPPDIISLATPQLELSLDETKMVWQEVENARWYEVFVNNKFLTNTMETEYLFSSYTGSELLISFKVRASKNGIYSQSEFSEELALDLRPFFVIPEPTLDEEEYVILFTAQSGVSEYEVYESDVLVNVVVLPQDHVGNTLSFSFADYIEVDVGKKLEFKIKAKENDFGKESDFSAVVEFEYTVNLLNPVVELNEENQTLFWDKQNGASHYEVFINDSTEADITILNNVSDTVVLNLQEHITQVGIYDIRVKAIGKDIYNISSQFSNTSQMVVTGFFDAPSNLQFNSSTNVLTWVQVNGANSYSVYLNQTEIANNVTQNSFNLTSFLEQGNIYSVKVKTNANPPMYESEQSLALEFIRPFILNAPQNAYIDSSKVLHWDAVANAMTYTIFIDSTSHSISASQTSFNLTSFLTLGKEYAIYLRAEGVGQLYVSSPSSTTMFYDNKIPLAAPLNVNKSGTNLTWNAVSGANNYLVEAYKYGVYEQNYITLTNSVSLNNFVLTNGNYEFFVTARPVLNARFVDNSPLSAPYEMIYNEISEPTGLVYNKATKTLEWDADAAVSSFVVVLNNEVFSAPSNSLNLTSILDAEEITQAKVKAISVFDGRHSDFCTSIMINNTITEVANYTDRYFYFDGWNDYKITSPAEMDKVVWYARTIQLFSFQVNCTYTPSTGFTNDFVASMQSYGETAPRTSYAWSGSGAFLTFNLSYNSTTFNTNNAPMANKEGDTILHAQSTALKARVVETRTRDNEFNSFYINNNIYNEVLAQNSDHLYLILESGSIPVFGSANSKQIQAHTVYVNMLQVLREIIDTSFTEFQKVLAIYDWLIYNGYYDYQSYYDAQESSECGQNTCLPTCSDDCSNKITQNNCFYLEGMFLNAAKRMPVCDSFAKAFVSMCRVEGIEAIKITGNVQGGGHAWNKVNIIVPGQSTKKWFFLDPTFDNQLIEATSGFKEILVHSYFLITDAQAQTFSGKIHDANARMYDPECNTEFNVFDHLRRDYATTLSSDSLIDCKINSSAELTALFTYLNATPSVTGLEISVEYTYSNIVQEFGNAGAAGWTYAQLSRTNTFAIFKNGV